jgi:methanogenic corrinoid protein MtbC1
LWIPFYSGYFPLENQRCWFCMRHWLKINLDPFEILLKGLAAGMGLIGKKYEKGDAFVPQLLIASTAMYAGMEVIAPFMKQEERGGCKGQQILIPDFFNFPFFMFHIPALITQS